MIQYDYGKSIQDQPFRITGFMSPPPMILRTAIHGLKANYALRGHQLNDKVTNTINQYPRLQEKYSRPDTRTDRLYKNNYVHPLDDDSTCIAVCSNTASDLVARPERTRETDDPVIHYGLIASANTLMKDAKMRDKIVQENNALCFEMEAGGLMNHFPCLVIRGICDYSDSHKNKLWQGYSAMVAAAYAKDIICELHPTKVESEGRLSTAILSGEYNKTNLSMYYIH